MSSTRFWALVLAAVSFLAGLAAGVLFAGTGEAQLPSGPFARYEQRLLDEYDLGPQRRRALRALLTQYGEDLERAQRRHLPVYQAAMEPDLTDLGVRYSALIRDKVLPPSQRQRYAQEAAGLPFPD